MDWWTGLLLGQLIGGLVCGWILIGGLVDLGLPFDFGVAAEIKYVEFTNILDFMVTQHKLFYYS